MKDKGSSGKSPVSGNGLAPGWFDGDEYHTTTQCELHLTTIVPVM